MKKNTRFSVPATVQYKKRKWKVTSVANNCFKNNKKLKEPFLLVLKAQALYGLDKKKQAITLMKKLVKKYPCEKEFGKVLNKMLNGGDSLHGSYEAIINFFENNQ